MKHQNNDDEEDEEEEEEADFNERLYQDMPEAFEEFVRLDLEWMNSAQKKN